MYRKQTPAAPIQHIESIDKSPVSPLEQMTMNRKTIAELVSPNLPKEHVRKFIRSYRLSYLSNLFNSHSNVLYCSKILGC